MRAGTLRHNVRLERQVTTKDEYGQPLQTWELIARRRASIEPLTGREYFTGKIEGSEISAKIRLRYDRAISDLKPSDRIVNDSNVYDIKSVINTKSQNRELICMVTENAHE